MTNSLTEKKFLTDDERDSLIDLLNRHKGERDSIMIRLALFTGARGASEILPIKPKDFGNNSVTIKASKNSFDRTVPLDVSFFREIQAYISSNNIGRDERIFPISDRQWRRIWDYWRPNPSKGSHCLRHTAGTLLYINCKDLMTVRAFLGHKQINNTMIYLQYVEGVRNLRSKMKGMWKKTIDDA
jgi:integrase